jgi:cytochrome oxidase Cu insertion factor (SCO1/SenC/PrrC family)
MEIKMSRQQALIMGIAITLTMLLIVGCGNPPASPALEVPTATSAGDIETEERAVDGPQVGDLAPDFTLPDSAGNIVSLADELEENKVVVLVFYHHHT